MKEQIVEFLEQLMEDAELHHLPQDFRARYLQQLRTLVEERVGILALKELHEEHVKEFREILEQEEYHQALEQFLRERIPGFQDKLVGVLEEFREQFLESVK
ncbi:MAG: hypothetical protein HYZ08_00010 [Candidatus Kerfeldbacteria bacterium]|nr:hypothetical protein [Candidatus Kerfeldbacteria bacterium]